MACSRQELALLIERNRLLAELVDLQREYLAFSKQQAAESTKKIGDFGDQLLKQGLQQVLAELRTADLQSIPEDDRIIMDHIREAIKKLEALTMNKNDGRSGKP